MNMDFLELPLVGVASVDSLTAHGFLLASVSGSTSYNMYVGALNSRCYLGKCGRHYILSTFGDSVGLQCTPPMTNTVSERNVNESEISGIYISDSSLPASILGGYRVQLTEFSTVSDMINAFNNQYGNPDSTAVIVSVSARISDNANTGGNSGQDSGITSDDGGYDDSSDSIPLSPLPNLSVTDTGMVTLFVPTMTEIKKLADYLWTGIGDVPENVNKWLMNPLDFIISLNIFPVLPATGTAVPIKIGAFISDIVMPKAASQWLEFSCGNITIPEYWGSYMDYSPYTKISAFLPFIGSVQLNTDEVMGRTVSLIYRIDLLSGECVANLLVGGNVYYQFTGQCSINVPLTGSDWSRVYGAIAGSVGAIMTGAGASLVNQTNASLARSTMAGHANPATKARAEATLRRAEAAEWASGLNVGSNVIANVMGAKGAVNHTGNISGTSGMLGLRTPYVMLEYPNQSLPTGYKHFVGYPSNMYYSLGSLSGYTVCEQVIANAPDECSEAELAEIISALKGGVYL